MYDFRCPDARRRGLRIVRDGVFFFKANAVSYSLRRSSSQNQNRTGALRLVDNFGAPLCRVLILLRLGRSFLCSGDEAHHHLRQRKATQPGGLSLLFRRESNGSVSEWIAGGNPEPRPGLLRSGGRLPSSAPRRRGLRIVRDDVFLRHRSFTSSLLLSKSKPHGRFMTR